MRREQNGQFIEIIWGIGGILFGSRFIMVASICSADVSGEFRTFDGTDKNCAGSDFLWDLLDRYSFFYRQSSVRKG